MVSLKLATLALTALSAVNVLAQLPDGLEVEDLQEFSDDAVAANIGDASNLAVTANVSFPDAEFFGIKLVNGRPTRALITLNNAESTPVTALVAVGALLTPSDIPGAPDPPQSIRNLTAQRYGVQIPAKSSETFTYAFATELHPQDLTLDLQVLIQSGESVYTLTVFRESVAVVEAPVSIFDPQIIFLYLFLAGAFGGTCYFIYSTWITTLFPQKKRGGKGGDRVKRSAGAGDGVDKSAAASVPKATGAAAYDESWIPASHLTNPKARKVGGRTKSRPGTPM